MQSNVLLYLESESYYVKEVESVREEQHLYVADGQGNRLYIKVTDQLKEQLARICQGWAFESEIKAREMAGEAL